MLGSGHSPWFDELSNGEESAQEDAQTTHDDVGDTQEGISTAHDGACRDQYRFGTIVYGDGEILMTRGVSK
jgi:hypothetical protein